MAGVSNPAEITIVLVHGGFVDGSGWEGVYQHPEEGRLPCQPSSRIPTLSLAGDVAATKLIVHAQNGPVILVGHSYGGAVITEAGTDPQVAGLVYIAPLPPTRASP